MLYRASIWAFALANALMVPMISAQAADDIPAGTYKLAPAIPGPARLSRR